MKTQGAESFIATLVKIQVFGKILEFEFFFEFRYKNRLILRVFITSRIFFFIEGAESFLKFENTSFKSGLLVK